MNLLRARPLLCSSLLLGVAAVGFAPWLAAADDAPKVAPADLERTRAIVKFVDELNKAYVVNITGTYVRAQEIAPAARIARKVFDHMESKKLIHSGRLIDVSGNPIGENNVAKSDFEKRIAPLIKKGEAYVDEVGTTPDGKTILRAATIVPCVMKECTNCHAGVKVGDVMGALIYEVPIIK
jgi:hypothetical protein